MIFHIFYTITKWVPFINKRSYNENYTQNFFEIYVSIRNVAKGVVITTATKKVTDMASSKKKTKK